MSDQIRVDADVLIAHASKVAQIADEVSTALGAVNSINLAGGAFGVLCMWMVPPAQLVSDAITSHIRETRTVLGDTEHELRGAVRDFAAVEEMHIDTLGALERALG